MNGHHTLVHLTVPQKKLKWSRLKIFKSNIKSIIINYNVEIGETHSLCLPYFRSKKNDSGKNQNLEGKDGAYLKVDVPQRTNVPKGCRTILIKLEITFERWLSKFRFPMAGNHGGLKI